MKEYRRRFIRLSMGLIAAVLLLVFAGIEVYLYHDYQDALRDTMRQVLMPLNDAAGRGTMTEQNEDVSGFDTITTVFYRPDSGEMTVLSGGGGIPADALEDLVRAASEREESYGLLAEQGVIFYHESTMDMEKLAFTPREHIRRQMTELTEILLAVFCAAMALFYGISRYISGLSVRPLEQAMEREAQFVADVSHDLKTPLTVILANGAILRETPEKTVAEQMTWIEGTENAAHTMLSMVNEMLTLSKVSAASQAKTMERVDLTAVAEKACLQLDSVAYEKGVSLRDDIAEGIAVEGDAGYLTRITSSLIENAVKYEPNGGEVRVRLAAEKNTAVYTVTNPGSVIAEADLPHIFERFYRADRARQGHGFGLGLAIAKEMTETMGGTLTAQSSPEKGTTFRARFPLARE